MPRPIRLIQTHPGSAHKDDFLACCLLIHSHRVPVLRAEPDEATLTDPTVCLVDVGHCHEPDRNNFDHHQLPRDHPPTCALSLVLQDLGLYEDARDFCDWLETTEWLDARGPNRTADWLGIGRHVLARLNSPVDIALLRRFSRHETLEPGDPLWQMMQWIGEDLVSYLTEIRQRMGFIRDNASYWDLPGVKPMRAIHLPRVEPVPNDPSGGLARFLSRQPGPIPTVAMVYPDRRSTGYALARVNDHPDFDFNRIAREPDVHFVHASGFLAKTAATDTERLRALLQQARKAHA